MLLAQLLGHLITIGTLRVNRLGRRDLRLFSASRDPR